MKKQKLWRKLCAFLMIIAMVVPSVPGTAQAEDASEETVTATSGTDEVTSTEADFMTEEEYASMGFHSIKSADSYVEDSYNPLDGYQPQILNELYIGYMNHPDDYNGYFSTAQEVSTVSAGNLNLNTMEDTNVGGTKAYYDYDDMETQCINTIGMIPGNMNEDGAEVREQILIESRLYADTDGRNSSHHRVQVYSLVDGSWKGGTAVVTNLASKDDWSADITIREQGGFNALTAGDFDGDGYNEVAVYNPTSSNNGGCIYIYQPEKQSDGTYTLKSDGEYWIKDFGSRFNWGDGKCRPLVSMTTTDLAGHDDIVVSVTLPYDDHDDACDAGVVGVVTYSGGKYAKTWWDTMVIGNEEARYKLQNVTNADLNGDGQDEIVIAGHKNTGYTNGSKRGSIDSDKMYVNVLLHDGETYKLAWSDSETPTVPRHPDLHVDDSSGDGKSENDPITLTAGKYVTGQLNDTVFCEGVFLHFTADETTKDANEQIAGGSFTWNASENLVFSNTDEAFIGAVATGCFVEDQRTVEQTVIVQGHNAQHDDNCDINITWFYGATDENGVGIIKQIESNNDFMDNANEDDNGTCVVLATVNVDDDSCYIKYKERYYGYSNPAVLGVMLSAPYWEEVDYSGVKGATSFKISYSDATSKTHEGAVGYDVGLGIGIGAEAVGSGASGGVDINFAAQYIHSKTSTNTTTRYKTFTGNAGEDMVALTVVPIVSYCYEIINPATGETQPMVVNTSYSPAFACISVDKYNRVAEQFNAAQDEGEELLTIIDLNEAFYDGYVAGDPSSYPTKVSEIDAEAVRESDTVSLDINGSGSVALGFSDEYSDTTTNGLCLSLGIGASMHAQAGVNFLGVGGYGYVDLSYHVTGSYSYTYAETNSEAYTYEGTVVNLPDAAQTGTDSYGNPTSNYAFSTQMVQWEEEIRILSESADGEVITEAIPFIGYITSVATTMPRRVTDLIVTGTTRNSALLKWTKPEDRTASDGTTVSVDHYKLYMSTMEDGEYTEIQTIDGDVTSYEVPGLEKETTYYFKIQVFDKNNVAGAVSDTAKGTTKGGAELVITKEPQNLEIAAKTEPWFSIEVQPSDPNGAITYKWQKLVDGSWQTVSGATESTFNPVYSETSYLTALEYWNNSSDLTYEDLVAQFATSYRCVVTEKRTDGTTRNVTSREAALTLTGWNYGEKAGVDLELEVRSCVGAAVTMSNETGYFLEGEEIAIHIEEDTAMSGITVLVNVVNAYTGETVFEAEKEIVYSTGTTVRIEDGLEEALYYATATFEGNDTYSYSVSNRVQIQVAGTKEVIYKLNDGVNAEENPTIVGAYGKTYTLSEPTKEDYEFLGWYTDSKLQSPLPGDAKNVLEPETFESEYITLYAAWKEAEREYNVTYVLNGGENGDNPSVIKKDDTITLENATKNGYDFAGWYLDEGFNTPCVTISGADKKDITVYAKWSAPIEYRINYVLEDGVNAESNPETYTIESDEIAFADASLDGYEFSGWYADVGCTTQITSIPKGSTGDVTIYAKWTLIDTLEPNEEGVYEIDSYEDLVEMARMIKYNPEKYAAAAYIQTANIDCDNQVWTLAIGSQDNPFEGTYTGNGYYIYGLRPTSTVAGLFGVIGVNGVVQNVSVVDFDYTTEARIASGLAALNYGTIIGCGSGEILSSATIIKEDGTYVLASDLASEIMATKIAGGLVAINEGTIKNSANGSNVTIIGESEESEESVENVAGGIAAVNTGVIQNVYQVGTISGASVAGSVVGENSDGGTVENSYYLDSTIEDSTSTAKTVKQFASGEVAYLLNQEVTDGTQVWYQNLDNGKVPNLNPKIVNNGENTVYVIRDEERYSNYSPYSSNESVLERVELRTYQRVRDENGKFSTDSKIAYGYGVLDNENKTITVYTTNKVERIGILMHQGMDGESGILRLQGDYDKLEETSKELLESGAEEPNIYTDGNGCIFIKTKGKTNEDIPELTVTYEQKPTEDYNPTEYTLIVKIVDPSEYINTGITMVRTLAKYDPDYAVVLDESVVVPDADTDKDIDVDTDKNADQNTDKDIDENKTSDDEAVKTGDNTNIMILVIGLILSVAVVVFVLLRRSDQSIGH